MAKTLTTISKNGVDEFYKGEIANTLSSYIIEKGGIITKEDFALYKPVWRESLELKYKNLNIITMGPPSSGGIVLGQILLLEFCVPACCFRVFMGCILRFSC